MLGVPVKVLHEAEGHIVTVETATGELYRGVLIEAEDNMNMQVNIGFILYYIIDKSVGKWNRKGLPIRKFKSVS